jgi:4-hydroxybenzoate polyprenyltransferase
LNFIKIIRSAEWWEYKLPPLLAIGYATVIKAERGFMNSIPHLMFLLMAIVIGAIYVSIINDLTDLDDDLASGKSNRMVGIRPSVRWLLPLLFITAGFACGYHLYPDWLSLTMYFIPWLAFSMYSFPPFRLKNRGIWGVLADASGSHIFTSLLMVSSLTCFTHQSMDWLWFTGTGIWALCYGVRGILWHQFQDRLNDIKANVKTFAVKINPERLRLTEQIIFFIELIAVATMLYCLYQPLTLIFLLIYMIIALTRTFKLKYKPVLILTPLDHPYHILMADFYQVYFPLSLLCIAVLGEFYGIVVLGTHLVLFPNKTLASLKDLKKLISYR